MAWNFNALEDEALLHLKARDFKTAREIYLVMGDGDPSLDAGSLAHRIGLTYEAEGRLMEAKYWFNRAVEENPTIEPYKAVAAKYKEYYPASFLKVIPNP